MQEELPDTAVLRAQMERLKMPMTPDDLGISQQDTLDAWTGSREIRDNYLCSSVCGDLGWMSEAAKVL